MQSLFLKLLLKYLIVNMPFKTFLRFWLELGTNKYSSFPFPLCECVYQWKRWRKGRFQLGKGPIPPHFTCLPYFLKYRKLSVELLQLLSFWGISVNPSSQISWCLAGDSDSVSGNALTHLDPWSHLWMSLTFLSGGSFGW